MLAMVLYVPFLRDLFRSSTLHPIDVVICLSAGLASIAWFEVLKMTSSARKLRSQQKS
jgi:P-type Ca2+ transporter type 2C